MVIATSQDDNNFIETVMDSYLTQHVLTPTRGRGTNEPSLIDLKYRIACTSGEVRSFID